MRKNKEEETNTITFRESKIHKTGTEVRNSCERKLDTATESIKQLRIK